MAQHDYDIANQTAPNFRVDLNNALDAIASTNSGTSAPSATFANMLWYDTTNNILKMRNEGNSAWIDLFDLDQSGNLSLQSNIASQAQAEAGTASTVGMTPQRTKQAIDALATGGSLTFLERVTASNSATVELTAFDNTTYTKGYYIVVRRARPATDGENLRFRLSTNGGSTWVSTNYVWRTSFSGNGTTTGSNSSGATYALVTWGNSATNEPGSGVDEGVDLEGRLERADLSGSDTRFRGYGLWRTTSGSIFWGFTECKQDTAAEHNAIEFSFAAGNITSGEFELYGINIS